MLCLSHVCLSDCFISIETFPVENCEGFIFLPVIYPTIRQNSAELCYNKYFNTILALVSPFSILAKPDPLRLQVSTCFSTLRCVYQLETTYHTELYINSTLNVLTDIIESYWLVSPDNMGLFFTRVFWQG